MQPFIIRTDKQRKAATEAVFRLPLNGGWQVRIEPVKTGRSLNQNALYWKWIDIIANETGNTNEAAHEALKSAFLPTRYVELGEISADYTPSTTKLTVKLMAAYMEKVQAWAASEMGIALPVPEEMHMEGRQ